MFKKIKKGVYYCEREFNLADNSAINFLVNVCEKESLNMARLCLHKDQNSKLMMMLIVVLDKYHLCLHLSCAQKINLLQFFY